MGLVSISEDIEKLRAEHEHFGLGVEKLVEQVQSAKSAVTISEAEETLQRLVRRFCSELDAKRKRAQEVHDLAVKLLKSPDSRIRARIEKLEQQRDDLRTEVKGLMATLGAERSAHKKVASELRLIRRDKEAEQERKAAMKHRSKRRRPATLVVKRKMPTAAKSANPR